jgi:hypothetical protein
MPEPKTVKQVQWRATPLGVCMGFAAARLGRMTAKGDEDSAEEVADVLRPHRKPLKAAFDALTKLDAFNADEEFDAHLAAFDNASVAVMLSPEAFAWMKSQLAVNSLSGAFAKAKRRMNESIENAATIDVPLAAPAQLPPTP